MSSPAPILTIGYGSRGRSELLSLLADAHVEYLVDVRSSPHSRFDPDFNRQALEHWLPAAGIRYVFRGDTLGGRPADASCYDYDGHVDYSLCRSNETFIAGVERLLAAAAMGHHICLLCSELKPTDCHRSRLLGEMLQDRGGQVRHFDALGVLRDHSELRAREDDGQLVFPTQDLGRSRKAYADSDRPLK